MKTHAVSQYGIRPRISTALLRGPHTKMLASKVSRGIVFAGAVAILGAYFAPLWHYDFAAPQYPEGLPMMIFINHLGGRVDLVNELNHYIGMLRIDSASFPELADLTWLVALLCAGGIVAAISRRLWVVGAWLAVFAVSGTILLGDFWWRLYEYGHNLNPHAAIKIAPFTPHLLGAYRIMNFQIVSYPGWGGIAMMLSFILGLSGLIIGWRSGGWDAHGAVHGHALVVADTRPVIASR